jgi:hypothetical protein
VEDAGQSEIWLGGRPMWGIARVNTRIDARWADGLPGLAHVLKTLAVMIHNLLEVEDIEVVFECRQARAGSQASVLGCHSLRVLDATHFLWNMEDWVRRTRREEWAHPIVRRYGSASRRTPRTQLVLNLMHVLGLRANYNIGNKQYSSKNLSYCPIHSCLVLVAILRSD